MDVKIKVKERVFPIGKQLLSIIAQNIPDNLNYARLAKELCELGDSDLTSLVIESDALDSRDMHALFDKADYRIRQALIADRRFYRDLSDELIEKIAAYEHKETVVNAIRGNCLDTHDMHALYDKAGGEIREALVAKSHFYRDLSDEFIEKIAACENEKILAIVAANIYELVNHVHYKEKQPLSDSLKKLLRHLKNNPSKDVRKAYFAGYRYVPSVPEDCKPNFEYAFNAGVELDSLPFREMRPENLPLIVNTGKEGLLAVARHYGSINNDAVREEVIKVLLANLDSDIRANMYEGSLSMTAKLLNEENDPQIKERLEAEYEAAYDYWSQR